jgi:hypothetical protein
LRIAPISLCAGGMWHTVGSFWLWLQLYFNLILIGGLHTKLWASKVTGVPTLGISKLPFVSPRNPKTKWHLRVGPKAMHIVYYKVEGGGFPQVQAVVNLVSPCLLVVSPCTKMLQLRTNQFIVWFVQVCVSSWIATLEVLWAKECVPTPFPSITFTFGLVVESIKEFEGVSINFSNIKFSWSLLLCFCLKFYFLSILWFWNFGKISHMLKIFYP